ncbi:MAG: hypothetical protein ABR563_09740 [Pyrinomonadaceae bacterium]
MATGSTKSRNRKAKQRRDADADERASEDSRASWGATKARDAATKGGETAKARDAAQQGRDRDAAAAQPMHAGTRLGEQSWRVWSAVVLVAAVVFRVAYLELKPLHHDEGVNGFFLLDLVRHGNYKYNPSNYHGPTLYYFTLPLAYFADQHHFLSTWVIRSVTVAFGLATVWLVLGLRRYVGDVGALASAALTAVSPGMVFFSRYYIHEMLFVFFTLGIVVGALRFYEGEPDDRGEIRGLKIGRGTLVLSLLVASAALVTLALLTVYNYATLTHAWTVVFLLLILLCLGAVVFGLWLYDGARSIYLVLASASAALMFATKETAFISAGVLLIAWVLSDVWVRVVARTGWAREPEPKKKKGTGKRGAPAAAPQSASATTAPPLKLAARFGGWSRLSLLLVAALAVFLFVNVIYYSSFFTNPQGVKDSLEAFKIWKQTGYTNPTHFHEYPIYKYVQWLVGTSHAPAGSETQGFWWLVGNWDQWLLKNWEWGEEAPLVLLAALGAALALWKTRRRFPLFAALWGFGLFAAYSLIKYKTPWLALSWLLPLAVAGGYAVDKLYRSRKAVWRAAALPWLGVCLLFASAQAYELNFVHYDDDSYPYVYAHTKRDFHDLLARMNEIAARTGDQYEAPIAVDVENQEYWPLPWYVRDYKHIGYNGHVVETNDAVILVKTSQVPEVESLLGARYVRVGGTYVLRPGVELALFARRDLAAK